jgi:hypothetical protein
MVTMIDELFDRQYHAARTELNNALVDFVRGAGKAIGDTFAVLNRIEYSAPWAIKPRRTRAH